MAEQLAPVIGRECEIQAIIAILARSATSNVALIGEAGTGKTAIVEGVAHALCRGTAHHRLNGMAVWRVRLPDVLDGADDVDAIQERVSTFIKAARRSNVILVLDEGAIATRRRLSAFDLFRPYLAHGVLRMIITMTAEFYHRRIVGDPALDRRFTPIVAHAMSADDAMQILFAARARYEARYGVAIGNQAIAEAVNLAHRFITQRAFPGKALELLDLAASMAAHQSGENDRRRKPTHDRGAEEIERMTSVAPSLSRQCLVEAASALSCIPIAHIAASDDARAMHVRSAIETELGGQSHVADLIVRALCSTGRRMDHRRPVGVFVLVVPDGDAIRALARQIALHWFGDEHALVRIAMSDYRTEECVAAVIDAAPRGGGDHGTPFDAIRSNPNRVVLIDDVEQAHPKAFESMLRAVSRGVLHTPGGLADMRNCVVLTGRVTDGMHDDPEDILSPEMREFVDAVIHVHPLSEREIDHVLRRRGERLRMMAAQHGVTLHIADEAYQTIIARSRAARNERTIYNSWKALRDFTTNIERLVTDHLERRPSDLPAVWNTVTVQVAHDGGMALAPLSCRKDTLHERRTRDVGTVP